jgi:hypothetical protein
MWVKHGNPRDLGIIGLSGCRSINYRVDGDNTCVPNITYFNPVTIQPVDT